ncbi:hypothetical protein [Burkholderia savannae]|uniref:hypothetical protein n=1 Tax=Burkholderia savannae TaxID=1637837 RepID=UPI000AD57D80|nr:hypothetical protein [Burkholderia savannae]
MVRAARVRCDRARPREYARPRFSVSFASKAIEPERRVARTKIHFPQVVDSRGIAMFVG